MSRSKSKHILKRNHRKIILGKRAKRQKIARKAVIAAHAKK